MPSTSDAHSDPTFRHYHASQAVSYAKARGSYSSELYSNVLSYHSSTSGAFDTLLDVGCGPGNATRDLASYFLHASGADPGAEMINEARRNGDDKVTASGEPITFFVGAAEQIAEKVKDSSVDLLVAAMAVSSLRLLSYCIIVVCSSSWLNSFAGTLVRYERILGCCSTSRQARRHRGPLDSRFALLS